MIWRETTQAFISGEHVVVGCATKDPRNLTEPFCMGFARIKPGDETRCPKCDMPMAADIGPDKRWRGLVPVI